jgi:hypothetical protein
MKSVHCRAITCTPVVAQTTLQVKLDSKLQIFENATPVLDDMLANLATNAETLFEAIFVDLGGGASLVQRLIGGFRQIPWKY